MVPLSRNAGAVYNGNIYGIVLDWLYKASFLNPNVMKLKAVFLDKDGTIVPEIPQDIYTETNTLSEGVVEGLQLLQSYGYLLVIVNKETGVARSYPNNDQAGAVKAQLSGMCSKMGIYLDGFYDCLSHPEGNCDCHKPEPELLRKAATDMDIDLSCSWMIGDILNDVETGKKAGCKTILIDNGSETEWKAGEHRNPEYKARDLAEAARYILLA